MVCYTQDTVAMRLSGNSPVMIGMLYTGHSGHEVEW